ncbi:MAG: redoxin family protein [Blastocatellia bacterium]
MKRSTLLAFCLLFAICAGNALAQSAASTNNYCDHSPAMKAEMKKLPKYDDEVMSYRQFQERRLTALQELVKKYPDDFHVQRNYLDARRYHENADREALRAEYRSRAEAKPADPVAAFFYAQLLVGKNTKEAIERLDKIAQQSPDFTPAYQELGQIYGYPAFRDQAKAKSNFKTWAAKCPGVASNIGNLSRSGDPDLMREALGRLRTRLAAATEPEDLNYYDDAWSLEFKLRPIPEHPQVRQQIAEEVKQLREKNLGSKEWLLALQAGYKNAGDKEGKRWAEDELLRLHPKSSNARRIVRQRWDEEHPRPKPDETGKMKAFNQALVKATNDWLKQWPDDVGFWGARYFAAQDLEDVSNAEVEAAAEGFLNAMAKNEGNVFYIPPVETMVAGLYVRRKIATERIPSLVTKGLELMEKRYKRDDVTDLYPRESGIAPDGNLKYVRWQSWPLLAEAHAKLKQPEKAREALAQMAEALKKEKPEEKAKQSEKTGYLYHQVSYWQTVAKVAEAESRKLDGLTAYQTALSFRPKSYKPMPGKKDELAAGAESLWKELGGTDEGWKAYLARNEASKGAMEAAEAGGWDAKGAALPDFALTDLGGRKWQLADLKGKVAFINFWATWCGPCVMELPYVQKLHEQMKDNKDVLVLTFNTDDELGLVEPFMKDKKYSFTVIPAQEYAQGQNVYSIPRNWVVGADGVLQFESIGFGSDGDEWMKKAIETIQKVKAKK